MVSGQIVTDLPEDMVKKLDSLIESTKGHLGPGCCQFYATSSLGRSLWVVSNVGDRPSCDKLVRGMQGQFVSYKQGVNCAHRDF